MTVVTADRDPSLRPTVDHPGRRRLIDDPEDTVWAAERLAQGGVVALTDRLDLARAEALVLSACVQMPSLASIQAVEDRTGLPTRSAATATARSVLEALGLDPVIPGGGALLAGRRPGISAQSTQRVGTVGPAR